MAQDTLAQITALIRMSQEQPLLEQIREVVLRNEQKFSERELIAALQAEIDRIACEKHGNPVVSAWDVDIQ